MTDPNNFFDRGQVIGGSFQEGADVRAKRGQDAQAASDISAGRQATTRGLQLNNDQTDYNQKKSRGIDAGIAATYADGSGDAPGAAAGAPTPTLDDYGKPLEGGGMQQAQPAAPAPHKGLDLAKKAVRAQQISQVYGKAGDIVNANKYEAEADSSRQLASFETGAANAPVGPLWDAAAKAITLHSPTIQVGKDKAGRDMLSIQQPNGVTTYHTLSETDKRNIMGASQMLNDGFVSGALGIFGKVDGNLAAAVNAQNEMQMKVSQQDNTTKFQEGENASQMVTAQAHATSARAQADKVDLDRMGHAVEGVNGKTGDVMVAIPVSSKKGGVEMKQIQMPPDFKPKNAKGELDYKKVEDGYLIVDKHSGETLGVATEHGVVPAEKDIFAGKAGEKAQAEWQDQGVVRQVGKMPSGKRTYAYYSTDDPTNAAWGSPEEAKAAGVKAKATGKSGSGGTAQAGNVNQEALDEAAKLKQYEATEVRTKGNTGIGLKMPQSEGSLDSGT